MQGDAKEDVRSRVNIEDIIGEYVELKKAGRNFKGLSPFTDERTPSFIVSPDKNIWHDFSSNKGGDVFSFIMEVEGMDFRQALELLARKAGVDLSLYETSSQRTLASTKKNLFAINQLATRYFQQSLVRNKHALNYIFQTRGFDKGIVEEFMIGYAPNSGNALKAILIKKGFSEKDIRKAGLISQYGRDIFRSRIMVPLMDGAGKVVGFTGRLMADDADSPKYLNTPQTLLYDKSRNVFGLSQAKQAIRKYNYAVIVEGNLDVVSSHQFGIKQVVATAGTAMTEAHLREIKRFTSDIRLAYDGDRAGLSATERAISIGARVGVELSVISLPEGVKDPDELVRKNIEQWLEAIESPQPAVDWILDRYLDRLDIETASGKKQFTEIGLGVVKDLHDPVEKEHYLKKIANIIDASYEVVIDKFMSQGTREKVLKRATIDREVSRLGENAVQDDLLALLVQHPNTRELLETLDISLLDGDDRQAVARYLLKNQAEIGQEGFNDLQNHGDYVKMLLLRADMRFANSDSNDSYYEVARLIRQIQYQHKKQTQIRLVDKLKDAELLGDEKQADLLRQELNVLIKEIARGK